jgi:integrase
MTAKAVWHIVKESAKCIGVPKLAPHVPPEAWQSRAHVPRSCRDRHSVADELEQIQFLLGHVSVQTTERYLGCKAASSLSRQ